MVEPQIVVLVVAGSSPVGHPSLFGPARLIVSVAQPDRASDFGSEGWGFESLQARCFVELVAIMSPQKVPSHSSSCYFHPIGRNDRAS